MTCAPRATRPSVLAMTSEPPWPLDSGGRLRTYHLLRMLARRFRVRLVVPARNGHAAAGRTALEQAGIQPVMVVLPPRTTTGETVRALGAAVAREPYVMFARHRHQLVERTWRDELRIDPPDVMYLDHLDSFAYVHETTAVPIVIDMHNVYSRLLSRAAAEEPRWARRTYVSREATLIARAEQRAVAAAHTVMAVSHDEARYFKQAGAARVSVVPNGVDCAAYETLPIANRVGPPTIVYVGSLDWAPNVAAARFLATEVLPAVRLRLSDARLLLVGRNPGVEVLALDHADGVKVVANASDVTPYLRRAHLLAVPLESGGGTRLKILEAFAAGLPVISTPIGCEGITAVDDEHLVVAERRAFARATLDLLVDPRRANRLAERARQLAREQYDWNIVGARACETVAGAALQTALAIL